MAEIIDINIRPGAQRYFVSSDQYYDAVLPPLCFLDFAVTLGGRYEKLLEDIKSGGSSDQTSQGVILDYTKEHPAAAAVLIAFYAIVGLYTLYCSVKSVRDKAKEKSRSQAINQEFNQPKELLEKSEDESNLTSSDKIIIAQFKSSLKKSQAKTEAKSEDQNAPVDNLSPLDIEISHLFDINYYLQKVLAEDAHLRKKYSHIGVTKDGEKHLRLTLADETPKKSISEKIATNAKDVIVPLWVAVNTASFGYWLIWIGAAFVTGVTAVGIVGVSTAVAFGVPGAIGLLYPLIKVVNWIRNKYFKERSELEAGDVRCEDKAKKEQAHYDASALMQRALDRRNADFACMVINQELDRLAELTGEAPRDKKVESAEQDYAANFDERIRSLGQGAKAKAATEFVTNTVSMFVCLQYAGWIISDFLLVIGSIAAIAHSTGFILGCCMLGAAVIAGATKAYETYHGVKHADAELKKLELQADLENTQITLQALLKHKMAYLTVLEAEVSALEKNVGLNQKTSVCARKVVATLQASSLLVAPPPPASLWSRFKTNFYEGIQGAMTGIFAMRTVVVAGTSPFYFLLLAPVLAHPAVIISVLVLTGVAFGALKVYQYHQNNKKIAMEKLLLNGPTEIAKAQQEIKTVVAMTEIFEKQKAFLEKQKAIRAPAADAEGDHLSIATTVSLNSLSPDSREFSHASSNVRTMFPRSRSASLSGSDSDPDLAAERNEMSPEAQMLAVPIAVNAY